MCNPWVLDQFFSPYVAREGVVLFRGVVWADTEKCVWCAQGVDGRKCVRCAERGCKNKMPGTTRRNYISGPRVVGGEICQVLGKVQNYARCVWGRGNTSTFHWCMGVLSLRTRRSVELHEMLVGSHPPPPPLLNSPGVRFTITSLK